jgi:hypothetical protein
LIGRRCCASLARRRCGKHRHAAGAEDERVKRTSAAALLIGIMLLLLRGGEGAAAPAPGFPVAMFQQCSSTIPGTARVTFVWAPADAGLQWLDLTLGDAAFPPGSFVSAGPLPPGSWAFTWDGLAAGRRHLARVNALTAGGWAPGPAAPFVTSACGSAAPATTVDVLGACGESPTGTLIWAPATPAGAVQWLDLTVHNNGFAPGTFISAGPFPPDLASFAWSGLASGLRHFWRINTWDGASWRASATGTFVPRCGVAPRPRHTLGCSTDWGPIAGAVIATLPVADGICVNRNSALPFAGCVYGCYYPDTREIWLPAGGPPRDDEYTLVHEICHTHQHYGILPRGDIASWVRTAEGAAFVAAARQARADGERGLTPPPPDFAAEPVEGFAHACATWYVEGKLPGRVPLSTWPALEAFARAWLPRA